MMPDDCPYLYDAASLAAVGRRDLQEDTLAMHFPAGSGLGYIVLADGMGGHSAGDVASKIVVETFFHELRDHIGQPEVLERNIGAVLRQAMQEANQRVNQQVSARPDQRGMGATLVAPVILSNRLYWISVGDSPLYLLRGEKLMRLNHEHSMARRLNHQVKRGLISHMQAEQNPDRHCLTSVLFGHDVPEIDCRDRPLDLKAGDILVVASDGLLVLDETRIAALVYQYRDQTSAEISARLLHEIREHDDPDQDNVTLCVVKVGAGQVAVRQAELPAARAVSSRPTPPRRTTIQMQIQRNGTKVYNFYSSESEG